MAKLLKITGKILGGIWEWLLILLIVIAFAIRTSVVQTKLAEIATNFLSKELNTELHIGRVDIYFFDRVGLDDVFVRDLNGDTLASLGSIEVVLKSLDLDGNSVTLRNIGLTEGRVGISRDTITGDYNYEFIADYFDSGSSKPKKPRKPIDLTIESLDIEGVDITYDDNRKSWSEYGMDYDHLGFKSVILHAGNFKSNGESFSFDLEKLSTEERSGFDLRRLKARARIGPNGIFLNDVIINTSLSRIHSSHFYLKMNGLEQMQESFEDSVSFNAVIDSSHVSLKDVSYFAPELKGMDQKIHLKAGLYHKVKNLKIANIDLRTGKRTIVRGDLILPDFDSLDGSFLKENLEYAYVDLNDLKALRLPDNVEERFISLNPMISRLGYVEVKDANLIGYWSQFVFSSHMFSTQLGTVHLDNGLMFTSLKEGGYSFERSANSNYDLYIDSFNLGKFIDEPLLGKVNGSMYVGGVVGQKDIIRLNKLDGFINRLGFNGYNYTNIAVTEGSFIDNIFAAKIDITDPHLELAFDGSINVNHGQKFNFTLDIPRADLGQLNITKDPDTRLTAGLIVDIEGSGLSDYSGTIALNKEFVYTEDSNTISIPELRLELTRGATDHVEITSDVADISVTGKINPNQIAASLNNALSGPLPMYFKYKPLPGRTGDNNYFDLTLDVKDASEVLAVFAPDLHIAPGTHLEFNYKAQGRTADVQLTSSQVEYDNILVRDITVDQSLRMDSLNGNSHANYFGLNDSLYVEHVDVSLESTKDNEFNTVASWNQEMANPAEIAFKTTFAEDDLIKVLLKRGSYFSVKNQTWETQNSSEITYKENRIAFDHLMIERNEQFISVNGVLSDLPEDNLTVKVNELNLAEFSSFITTSTDISGKLEADVKISTPFKSFKAEGVVNVDSLVVNKEPVGDIFANGLWDPNNNRIAMNGELEYLRQKTFDFTGYYYPYKEQENLDFDLDFDGMDLQFANAFIDPTVVRDIHGQLKGSIHVSGEPDDPVIGGKLNLLNGSAKIAMLGVSYKLGGPIVFDGEEGAFYINNMPITDEEGNTGSINATINHIKFEKWNCDIGINMEDDMANRNYWSGGPRQLERFLVLNTSYDEGQIYYGRAYVTGTANIFVTEENTEITVDVKTARGSAINIPMYGNSEIEEGEVVDFYPKHGDTLDDHHIDLSSVILDLNFDVTDDVPVKLIFNERTHDEIIVYGHSEDLHIQVDNSDVKMLGTYTIGGNNSSRYNFAMGPIKQVFQIVPGGTLTWTGDPVNAGLNLTAYNKVQADINAIAPDVVSSSPANSSGRQEVRCIMKITQTLNDPLIILDIDIPNASDNASVLLARIKSSPEETQRQFFSLLVLKKFAPLAGGQTTVGTGGLADVLGTQATKILEGFINPDNVKLNVDLESDQVGDTKRNKVAFGGQLALGRSFIFTGSFGVASNSAGDQSQTNYIGDAKLEYLVNDDGSFRISVFNESNEKTVIQDKSQGNFTQGVGVNYREEFNTLEDFKLVQSVFDVYRRLVRKERKVKIKKRRHEEPIFKKETTPPADPPANNDTSVVTVITNPVTGSQKEEKIPSKHKDTSAITPDPIAGLKKEEENSDNQPSSEQ